MGSSATDEGGKREMTGAEMVLKALQDQGVTSFVRCMLVPLALKGQSTFKLADPADSTSPRLQMTHRHIDHPVYVDAG